MVVPRIKERARGGNPWRTIPMSLLEIRRTSRWSLGLRVQHRYSR